jgi:TonB family protein
MKILAIALFLAAINSAAIPLTSQQELPTSSDAAGKPKPEFKVIERPAAPYPKKLLKQCIGGLVTFRFSVAENGRVTDIEITSSPHELISSSVIETLKNRWIFAPYVPPQPGKLVRIQSVMSFDPGC